MINYEIFYSIIFRAEESLTQQSIEPLKVHLLELESAVEEQLDL